jgi:hypothetical protein
MLETGTKATVWKVAESLRATKGNFITHLLTLQITIERERVGGRGE